MDFLRRHAFWLICIVVAGGGIALGVTGLRAMPGVVKQMDASTSLYRNLDSLRSNPVNEDVIDAENHRVEAIQEDYREVLDKAKALYDYKPLVPEALPDGPPLKRIEFRKKYAEAMDTLFAKLKAGSVATATEIASLRERRENELAAERTGTSGRRSGYATQGATPRNAAGFITTEGVRDDPQSRASIAKALSFFCYGVSFAEEHPPDTLASLQFNEMMKDQGTVEAPLPFDVWMAQVGYWIQKDVVNAIVAVNARSEQEAKQAGERPWVGNMAVKDVISIRLSSYVPPSGELFAVAKPGDYTPAMPPGTAETVFTGTRSGPDYEVVQFTIKLVMDQRDIPLLIEELSNNRFHTLVRAAYTTVPPNRDLKGKIYGSEPIVNVVLDFETVMLGGVFRPMMPESVCEFFEIPCPPRETAEEEGS